MTPLIICGLRKKHAERICRTNLLVKHAPPRSGLRPGDVILEIGGSKVQSVEALVDCMEALKGRDKFEIVLIRAGGDGTPEKLLIGLKTA